MSINLKKVRKFNYQKIDAFTSDNSLGNPAACLYLSDNQMLSNNEMLAIAKQHKGFVSEVVFCSKLMSAEYKLIYFSSECEVDFCGHGTIACIYSLIKDTPELLRQKEIKIHTNKKGVLTVHNEIEKQDAIFISAPAPEYIGTGLKENILAGILQLKTNKICDKHPIDVIDAGLKTLIVPITTLEDEINIFPNEVRLKEFCEDNQIDIILTFSSEVKDKSNIAHTRVFAPKFGYLEDPATGSGNSAFGYYMLKNNMWKGDSISIEQGGACMVYNTIKLVLKGESVLFGGSATTRIKGEYFI